MRMWGDRTGSQPDAGFDQLNASIGFDRRLFNEDVDGSLAWARGLGRAGILTATEVETICAGLEQVRAQLADAEFEPLPSDEDIHTAVERLLTEQIGPLAGKLHTGRSRNDQVATDFRMWVMRACDRMNSQIAGLAQAVLDSAQGGVELPMPGYTHTRPAQPVTWGHWMMAAFWPLWRSKERFERARAAASVLPLGSGALAGTGFAIDRRVLAEELGFDAVSANSIDAVSDREFALEFLFAATLLALSLSRMAETLIAFSGPEFGFVELDPGFTSGSSLMPQKRNPDALELTRGKGGRLIGLLTGLLATLKGLPSAYDKDLQGDKQPVFEAFDTLAGILPVLSGLIGTLQLNQSRIAAGVTVDLFATDLADYLVGKGATFREAHRVVTQAVNMARKHRISVDQLPLEQLQALDERIESDVAEVYDVQAALARRNAVGGTAPEAVRAQLKEARKLLAGG